MATLRLDIDESLLAEAESVAADMGMDLETAVRVFLKQMVRKNGLPFRPGGGDEPPRRRRSERPLERWGEILEAVAGSLAEQGRAERNGEKRCPVCGCLYSSPGRVCPSCAQSAA